MLLCVMHKLALLVFVFPAAQAMGNAEWLAVFICAVVGVVPADQAVFGLKGLFQLFDSTFLRCEGLLQFDKFKLDVSQCADEVSDLQLQLCALERKIALSDEFRYVGSCLEAAKNGADRCNVGHDGSSLSPELWAALDTAGIDTILLVAPTTEAKRLPLLLARCRGFVYCLSRTGVTGAAGGYGGSVPERIAELRQHTQLPIAVGFGISSGADAQKLQGVADAVIVGAAFMRRVTEDPNTGASDRVVGFAKELSLALRA